MDGHLQASHVGGVQEPWNHCLLEVHWVLIYLINNTPQHDDLVLRIIDEPDPNEYENNKETQGGNNEYA